MVICVRKERAKKGFDVNTVKCPLSSPNFFKEAGVESILMIDGGFLKKKYKTALRKHIEVDDVKRIASNILKQRNLDNLSYRIYYYDCPPSAEKTTYPISHKAFSFENTSGYRKGVAFIDALKREDFFSVREGVLSFKGWTLTQKCYDSNGNCRISTLTDECFKPNLQQKGVDTKIGLDIAWASYEKIAKNIILVTGDSDFTPAMKTARRNGLFVYLYTLHHGVRADILNNADVLNTELVTAFT